MYVDECVATSMSYFSCYVQLNKIGVCVILTVNNSSCLLLLPDISSKINLKIFIRDNLEYSDEGTLEVLTFKLNFKMQTTKLVVMADSPFIS